MSRPAKLPTTWKTEFKEGETIVIKGHGFYVARKTKRGLALRKAKL